MNTTQQVIILSAERTENSFEKNRQLTENLAGCLEDLNITASRATGVYNGSSESSFVAIVKSEADIEAVTSLAFKSFNQDAIIHQDSNQEAYLLDKSGKTIQLGRLLEIPKTDIENLENYTLLNGKYYATVKRT